MLSVQVIPDRFKKQTDALASSLAKDGGSQPHVRRMTRGIVLHEETFATMRVVAGSGANIPIVDAGSRAKNSDGSPLEINGKRATDIYSNFLLQNVQEERSEKAQILETFGEAFIFLFGERARIITFQGVLANTFDFNWEAEWWDNYENYLRGTRCIEQDARIFLSFDHTLVGGYIVGCAATKNSENPAFVNFQFQLFVTNYSNFSHVGDPSAFQGFDEQSSLQSFQVGQDNQVQFNLTEKQAQVFRPVILTEIGTQIRDFNINQSPSDLSLADGFIQGALAPVLNAFNAANKFVNQELHYLSNLLNGDVVRVPVGFAGSLVYDEGLGGLDGEKLDKLMKSVTFGGSLTYGTFDQNNDEYVGAGDHYGSSVNSAGVVQYDFGDQDLQDVLDEGTALYNQAKKQWEDAGLDVPDSQESAVSALLVSKTLGLVSAGATEAWRQSQGTSVGFNPAFLAGGLAHTLVAPQE